jgi:predicted nucleotidyltransferase
MRSDFPQKTKDFFKRMENYLDTDFYYYGSVNRPDYVHDKSDIDIAIFTDNEYSTMAKLQHYLHVKRSDFDKVVWKVYGKLLYGYKIKCDKFIDIKCEIAIYNNEYKDFLLPEIKQYNSVPMHVGFLLFILKTLHYTFPIISQQTYATYKRYIFNNIMLDKRESVFLILKQR